ncbi:hypothetical protein [Zhongshania sp.]|uniref:hypothetical protein n=1 Tax=Zhongshania sp. TaxID=1971902 RepID=UPI001B4C4C87|nr:hypothetical protein [Zhongshania sp.]MBQ0795918.1 hypothetical protein [Zhongshania sp.]
MKKLMIYFSAGSIGALTNSLMLWWVGYYGFTSRFDIAIAPHLSPEWLYPRIVWGGLWGLLFILPMLQSRLWLKGLIISLAPTAVQLLLIFPQAGKGIGGTELGMLTPILVLLVNGLWGVTAALSIRFSR